MRVYQGTKTKCNSIENNMCETFNAWILISRHKSIITMLNAIRTKIMQRIQVMRDFANTWICDITPIAMERYEKNKEHSMECDLIWNGDAGFEVQDGPYGHTVDIRKQTCTCRSWQLKGIPCAHAICALQYRKMEPMDFISKWYYKETYFKTYSHYIQPILRTILRLNHHHSRHC